MPAANLDVSVTNFHQVVPVTVMNVLIQDILADQAVLSYLLRLFRAAWSGESKGLCLSASLPSPILSHSKGHDFTKCKLHTCMSS